MFHIITTFQLYNWGHTKLRAKTLWFSYGTCIQALPHTKIFNAERKINFTNKTEIYLTVNFRIKYFILQLIAKNVSTRALQNPPKWKWAHYKLALPGQSH